MFVYKSGYIKLPFSWKLGLSQNSYMYMYIALYICTCTQKPSEQLYDCNGMYICMNVSIPMHAGTLLHFEDHGLKNIYFLDPQWLAKLMADVIRPAAVEKGSPIQNGQSTVYSILTAYILTHVHVALFII